MGLIYCGASVYSGAYNGNYLMHGRTVGSRNGISNTPGYKAKGELAKGRWVNGVYIPAERDTFNARVGNVNASLAKKNLRAGNAGGTARYAGQTVRSYAKQAGKDIRRAADIAYNTTREFATGEHAKAYLDSLMEQKKGIERTIKNANGVVPDNVKKSNAQLTSEIERAQKLYDRTIPGMIDKAKYVGGQAWNSVKSGARTAMEKARGFIEDLWGKAKKLGGSAWKKIQPIADRAWSTIKSAGKDALKWGSGMVEKIVGTVEAAAEFVTGNKARQKMNTAISEGSDPVSARESSGYNKTLPGMVENTTRQVGKNVETVAMNVGSALNSAVEATGDFITRNTFSVWPKSVQNAVIKDLAEKATENMQKSRTAETDAERAEYEARALEYQDKINILEGWRRK